MPVPTPCWTTADGEPHKSFLSSLKHELALFLAKNVKGDELRVAKKFVDGLSEEQITEMRDLLSRITNEQKTPTEFRIVALDPVATPTAGEVPVEENASSSKTVVPLGDAAVTGGGGEVTKLFVDPSVERDSKAQAA